MRLELLVWGLLLSLVFWYSDLGLEQLVMELLLRMTLPEFWEMFLIK